MSDSQSQRSGHSSTNIQSKGDISFGLSYSDAKEVAMDVFRANFITLRDEAAELAVQRAQVLLDSFLEQASTEGLSEIPEGKSPDFQYVLYSAQREYARTGDEDLSELLVQLLIDRTKIQERDLTQIVLGESLSVAPKLTPDQMDALSLMFLLKYTVNRGVSNLDQFHTYCDKFILPFAEGASWKQSAYQHLEFAGCGNISIGSVDLEQAFRASYKGLFSKGFTEAELDAVELTPEARTQLIVPCLHNSSLLQINALNDEVLDNLCVQVGVASEKAEGLKQLQESKLMENPELRQYLQNHHSKTQLLFSIWDTTPMKNMTLTSVGIAIAHANIKKQIGESFDLSIWI